MHFPLPGYQWNPHALPWIAVGVGLIVLAAVIFRRQRASRVAVLFCGMIALVALWFAGFTGMLLSVAPETAIPWARIALAAICFLPATIYDFTATALRLSSDRRPVVRAVYGVSGIFALVAIVSGGLVGNVRAHPWGWYPVAGPVLAPFLFFFFAALLGQLAEGLVERRRTMDRQRRRRIAELLLSFVVVYFAAIDFLPMFGAPWQPIGWVAVIAFVIVAWTSIRRHRLPSITAARAAREILETMADALFVIDATARIRVVNGAVTTLLGYDARDLLGKSIDTLEHLEGDETISRTLHELASRGPIRDQERLFRTKGNEAIDVSVSISPISERDVQEGAVVIVRDIRERKSAEEELRSSHERLEQSNRELEDFAYVASHDLQEPLRKIQAFGDRLKSKYAAELPDQARDYVERMQSAAQRMQVLINDLLSFSRVTTRGQPFVPVDLGVVAAEVAHDLEVRTNDVNGHIAIGPLPTIDADPLQMRQLLQNLTSNALKFHREDAPPRVDISGDVAGGRAHVVVADNGIGFEEKYADRIFTMFERLHGRGQYEGTGIGLAICRKIAERHGGSIVASSTPGEGSKFTISLPLRQHETNGEHRRTES
jgi:PAS domain S-box-containing protein